MAACVEEAMLGVKGATNTGSSSLGFSGLEDRGDKPVLHLVLSLRLIKTKSRPLGLPYGTTGLEGA